MRVINAAIVVVLAVSVWSITPTAGKAPQPKISINPATTTTQALPEEQYDRGTIL